MSLRAMLTMTPAAAVRIIALISAILVAGAYVLQYGFNMQPCELCWLQRYVHWALLIVALMAMVQPKIAPRRALQFLIGLCVVGMGIGVYHSLVAAHVVVAGCGQSFTDLAGNPEALLALLSEAPVPACDQPHEIAWLSLPQWNILVLGLMVVFMLYTLGRKTTKKAAVTVVPAKKTVPAKKVVPAKKSAPVKKVKPAAKAKKTKKKGK